MTDYRSIRTRMAVGGRAMATAALLVWGSGAQASTWQDPYTGLAVVGDSYGDTGNAAAAGGRAVLNPLYYFEKRFSDGPVYSDYLAAPFREAGKPVEVEAFGGATVETVRTNRSRDLDQQLWSLRRLGDALGPRPLVVALLGANDIGRAAAAGDTSGLGDKALRLVRRLTGLAKNGYGDIVVMTAPDLSVAPIYDPRFTDPDFAARAAPLVAEGTMIFNDALRAALTDLAGDQQITLVDANALFFDFQAAPETYGLSELELPCLFRNGTQAASFGQTSGRFCSPDEAAARLWMDVIHPTTVVHGFIAGQVEGALAPPVLAASDAQIAPVPLPAAGLLLLAALTGLGGLARCFARETARPDPEG